MKFSDNALPPNCFPLVASSHRAGSQLRQPEGAWPLAAGPGAVPGHWGIPGSFFQAGEGFLHG